MDSFTFWICHWLQLNDCCSVVQSCLTLCDPMDCSMPAFPVLHHLPELAQIYDHWVGDVWLAGSKSRYERVLAAQSCLTLCDLMDSIASSSPVHGTSQTRTLGWITIPFSRGSSWPRNHTLAFCIARRAFTIWATREAQIWADLPRDVVVPVTHSLDESAGREDEKIQIDFRKFLRTNVRDLIMGWIWGVCRRYFENDFWVSRLPKWMAGGTLNWEKEHRKKLQATLFI